jgi:hypothetical protein
MSSVYFELFQSFTLVTYCVLVGIIFFLGFLYIITPKSQKQISFLLILLVLDIFCLILVPFYVIWIPVFLFIVFLVFIFNHRFLTQLFIIEEDSLFIDRNPQIWEKFPTPPELKSEENVEEST